jgi:hypothetical protein
MKTDDPMIRKKRWPGKPQNDEYFQVYIEGKPKYRIRGGDLTDWCKLSLTGLICEIEPGQKITFERVKSG